MKSLQFSSVQLLSRVRLFVTPWITACQASLSTTNSQSSLRLMPIKLVMPSSHPILCRPLLLLPLIPPSIRVFSSESTLLMRWPNSNTTLQKHQFFGAQPSSQSNSHIHTWPLENQQLPNSFSFRWLLILVHLLEASGTKYIQGFFWSLPPTEKASKRYEPWDRVFLIYISLVLT